jgi:Cu/Ag efflux protein CusF
MNKLFSAIARVAILALSATALAHEGHQHIQGAGVVNSVDEAKHAANISLGPIAETGWPAMTMDFAVAPSIDLKAIRPGTKVQFLIEKGADGLYRVESLKPAAEGK